MQEGDIILLGRVDKDNLKLIITEKNSKYAKQLLNLFENDNNKEVYKQTETIHSDTSNLQEYKDLKIYKNTKTNKIVVVGKATKIKDGDTIVISDLFNVRLYGIDTPESKQLCKNKNGDSYKCGELAKKYLTNLIDKKNLICVNNGNEKYGRFLFICKNNNYNINQEMVRKGWALSYFNDEYKADEEYAEKNKLGIWQGEFERSEIWRKNRK